jgi:thiol-disulfide isomerase/thioredoxin
MCDFLVESSLIGLMDSINDKEIIIIRFTADWCGPCKKIDPIIQEFLKTKHNNINFYTIDVDESLDLYMKFKKYKMLNGIPALLAYKKNVERDFWYIPDDSHLGGDVNGLNNFFSRCNNHVD